MDDSHCATADREDFDAGRAALIGLVPKGEITADDVAWLRRDIFGEYSISRDEAEAMFLLDAAARRKCPEWITFFVEAITEHVVWDARPTGVVNGPQAEWLIACVDRAKTVAGFAALVN